MKRFVVSCLLVAGCTSEYDRKYGESESEYEARVSMCDERDAADEHVFSLVNTDRWRVGATPFWSTSERVRAALGPPDTTHRVLQLRFGPKLEFLGYDRLGDRSDGRLDATVVNDSLAYLSYADLRTGPLSTDRGDFEPGSPLSAVREAFPESYECRDWGRVGGQYHDNFYPVLVATDTTRGAQVFLLFQDERLVSVGTDYYMQERVHGSVP